MREKYPGVDHEKVRRPSVLPGHCDNIWPNSDKTMLGSIQNWHAHPFTCTCTQLKASFLQEKVHGRRMTCANENILSESCHQLHERMPKDTFSCLL